MIGIASSHTRALNQLFSPMSYYQAQGDRPLQPICVSLSECADNNHYVNFIVIIRLFSR